MIIQCEQCRTKFRLDDEKVSDRGVKVRCAKCRHVFVVHKPSTQGDSATADPAQVELSTNAPAFEPASRATVYAAANTPSELELSPTGLSGTAKNSRMTSVAPDEDYNTFNIQDTIPQSVNLGTDGLEPEEPAGFSNPDHLFAKDSFIPDEPEAKTEDTGILSEPPETTTVHLQESLDVKKATSNIPDITFESPIPAEDAPPLTISSRRRQGSTATILIVVITTLVLAVLGYIAYTFINDGHNAVSMFGKSGTPVEEGKITVQNINGLFISTSVAGELLVINGDAVNNYKKPRAALQVKGIVYGPNNQVVATKTAFAGNRLTPEQLAEMTVDKIEAAMNNQFGDSLTNLEVQPGKTIPFTIVIVNPPLNGKDFGVEPVGSTVAASK